MTDELRFDGRVAIVTGAGGPDPSLGHSYARALAMRGAKVVVNDLGGVTHAGAFVPNAEAVVKEIVEAGGEAVASTNSVAEEPEAQAIVQTALDTWGRVDILINNAGRAASGELLELSAEDIKATFDVHVLGTIWMCRAVWPHMQQAGYGRIVNIVSTGILGSKYMTAYGGAKAGIWGFTRSLAVEGKPHGIKVNAMGPGAGTAVMASSMEATERFHKWMAEGSPERVAPMAAVLSHEDCPVSGRLLYAMRGRMSEMYLTGTRGYRQPEPDYEGLLESFDVVTDRGNSFVHEDPLEQADFPWEMKKTN